MKLKIKSEIISKYSYCIFFCLSLILKAFAAAPFDTRSNRSSSSSDSPSSRDSFGRGSSSFDLALASENTGLGSSYSNTPVISIADAKKALSLGLNDPTSISNDQLRKPSPNTVVQLPSSGNSAMNSTPLKQPPFYKSGAIIDTSTRKSTQ